MSRCAADGQAAIVGLQGVDEAPTNDRWVSVTGTFQRMDGDIPQITVDSVVLISQPTDPYESD